MMNKFGEQLAKFLKVNNISVNEFAERIDTTPKNLIDILKGNIAISQNMIYNISFITGISVSYIENVENSFNRRKKIDEFLYKHNMSISDFINNFHYKEFSDLYKYQFTDIRDKYEIAEDILKYLRYSNPENIFKDDNKIFYKSNNDKPELLALWLEHCYRVVNKQKVSEYKKENIEKVVSFIKEEACKKNFNKETLIKVFNENGIMLAIEPDLKGSKIRGAFKVLDNIPAIYITTKHKRIADIYFSLLHELAHCKSDFNRAKNGSIVSYIDNNEEEDYEVRADKTAFNWMVDDDKYENIIKTKDYHCDNMCFLVYRLAIDKIISFSSKLYQDNNILID